MTRWVRWLPAILIAAAIVTLSSLSPAQMPVASDILGWDKLAHFAAFAALAAAARFASPQSFWILVGVALFGASDELHQSFTPGRDASGWDLLADVVGAVFALGAWRVLALPGTTQSRVT